MKALTELTLADFGNREGSSDSIVFHEVITENCYHFDLTEGRVVDIGANIGTFTVRAVLAGCTVFAYEPEADNFRVLKDNCTKLLGKPDYKTRYNVSQLAIGSGESTYMTNQSGGSRRSETKQGESVTVRSLNRLLKGIPVDFMKMDCEGSEYDILLDATSETLKNIARFAIEFHPDLTTPETHERVIKKLDPLFELEITGNIPDGMGGIIFGVRK